MTHRQRQRRQETITNRTGVLVIISMIVTGFVGHTAPHPVVAVPLALASLAGWGVMMAQGTGPA
jgi:hypothetical protein